ncbi:MAG: FKBP-type peptidyl-prolyl cis-trans isomerase [Oscillospiraceae bacterium]|nr:FKBP-type peptidyl-prolyl cis-trans isomerase [Oscillospiraceae bacterium]
MKKHKIQLCRLLVLVLLLALLTGCGDPEGRTGFAYSEGIDENGFWEGVKALDYVGTFTYKGISVPADVHQIPDEAVQDEINGILSEFSTDTQITDRAVADGDTVNIDFAGSVDGVPFAGGDTEGKGYPVVIGETNFIDDFIDQLIGTMPGDTINVEVTFPDEYPNDPSLAGQDAVFVTTINFIVDKALPELTDEFVKTNLSESDGWETVAEMQDKIRAELHKRAVREYIDGYLKTEVPVQEVPAKLITYQEKVMLEYYQGYADNYGMELEEFLSAYVDASSVEELIETKRKEVLQSVKFSLIVQAIAEDGQFTVSNQDLADYFAEYAGSSDYSMFEEEYGLPWLKQVVLTQKVLNYIADNAVLA